MRKDQANLLRLIKEIDAICKERHIVYYAAGGTVIGALRHKGFIPWDDDIDIYMTRDNWNRFRECFHEIAPDRRILECWENNKGYHNLLGRYMDIDTTSIFKYQIYGDANMGQLIDVFVLDPIVGTKEAIKEYEKTVMLTSDLISECIIYSNRLPDAGEYRQYYERMEAEGKETVVNELFAKLEQYSEEESDTYMLRWGGMPHIFPKEMFAEPKFYPFEDMLMPLPSLVSDYLVQLYGLDWVNIPGRDGQITHNSVSNNDYPFATFKELIVPRVNAKAEEKYLSKKQKIFENLPFLHRVNNSVLEVEGAYVKNKVLRRIKEEQADVLQLVKERNSQALGDLFAEYIDMQISKQFIGSGVFGGYYKKLNPTFIDMGDDNLYAVLWYLMENGKISKADRLLQIRETVIERPLHKPLCDTKRLLDGLKAAAKQYEFKRYTEAKQIVDELWKTTQNNQLYKFKLFLMQRLSKNEIATQEYILFVEEAITRYPTDIDFLKFKADYLWETQEKEKALCIYTEVMDRTRNGMIALHIREQLREYIGDICEYAKQRKGEWRHIFSVWFYCYGYEKPLFETYVQMLQSRNYDMFMCLYEKHIRKACEEEQTLPMVVDILAETFSWKRENVHLEIMNTVTEMTGITREDLLEDGTDISRYQEGLYDQHIGEKRNAYAIYEALSDTDDIYVRRKIALKFKQDFRRYIKQTKEGKEKLARCDYKIRYADMPFSEYIQLLKKFEIATDAVERFYKDRVKQK